jgi:hypothetical protein
MPVGAKRLLPQDGNAIFCRGQLGAYAKIALNGSFNALKKCLSARNASCRKTATPFFAEGNLARMLK